MPTLEEVEAMARITAEVADTLTDTILWLITLSPLSSTYSA